VICIAVVVSEISDRSGHDAAIRSESRFAEIVELIGWRRNTNSLRRISVRLVSGEITSKLVRLEGLRDMSALSAVG